MLELLEVQDIGVHWIDLVIIGVYMVFILLAGVCLTRLASHNINSYFLGERKIPWWGLGLSGTASYFDVAGIMWTVAFCYIMGRRFMWIQWEWGFLSMVFFAAFKVLPYAPVFQGETGIGISLLKQF